MKIFFLFSLFLTFLIPSPAETSNVKKYALITGASRGIGRSLVEEILERDQEIQIFAVARGQKDLSELAAAYPDHVIPIIADLSIAEDLEHIQKTVQSTLLDDGALSYLVHNAAIITPIGDPDFLHRQPIDSMMSMMDSAYRTNVIAPHLLTVALLPELKRAKDAKVLFVSSRAGDVAVPGAATYSCTKAALDHLVLNLQSSLQGEISIGTLHPGEVDTDMQAVLRAPGKTQSAISAQFREAKEKNLFISPMVSAKFIAYLLYDTSFEEFSEKKWDIYYLRPSNFPDSLAKVIGAPPGYLKPL